MAAAAAAVVAAAAAAFQLYSIICFSEKKDDDAILHCSFFFIFHKLLWSFFFSLSLSLSGWKTENSIRVHPIANVIMDPLPSLSLFLSLSLSLSLFLSLSLPLSLSLLFPPPAVSMSHVDIWHYAVNILPQWKRKVGGGEWGESSSSSGYNSWAFFLL